MLISLAFLLMVSALSSAHDHAPAADVEPVRYLDSLFQEVERSTYTYARRGGEALEVDLYEPKGDTAGRRPLVLYVHGGGFSGGRRDGARIENWARHLARRGYLVASMSYQLTMRGRSFHCDQPAANKVRTFQVAAGDIRACTAWMLQRADALRLRADAMVLAGSSAGAEAIVHAGYWSRDQLLPDAPVLPESFGYAGLISMAGALVDTALITPSNAVPVQMFHGTCDNLVPYASAAHHYCPKDTPGALWLHGAHSMAARYRTLGRPYQLITVCRGGHEWAGRPLDHSREQIIDFLYHDVLRGDIRQLHRVLQRGEACTFGDQPAVCGS